jgi:hypothetical protein
VKRPIQLTFGGGHVVPQVKPRGGCIGKVERLIDERPWLTAGEIAAIVREPAGRVSMALNKLKHEGRAQQQAGLGQHRRTVWAGKPGARPARRSSAKRQRQATKRWGARWPSDYRARSCEPAPGAAPWSAETPSGPDLSIRAARGPHQRAGVTGRRR